MPDIRPLCPALSKLAAEELNEKTERIQNDIDTLRDWIIKTPHLKARIDDQFLVTFLRGCKYSLERAKQKLDTFYTVRTLIPELIKNRDPMNERLQAMIRLGCVSKLFQRYFNFIQLLCLKVRITIAIN